jgi:hypothetical protein
MVDEATLIETFALNDFGVEVAKSSAFPVFVLAHTIVQNKIFT